MNIDSMISGYPLLVSIRRWSLDVGHPTSCLIEMAVILTFMWLVKYTYMHYNGRLNEK